MKDTFELQTETCYDFKFITVITFIGSNFSLSHVYPLRDHYKLKNDQLPLGLIAQLVEHCTGVTEVMGSIPFQAWIFSDFLFLLLK